MVVPRLREPSRAPAAVARDRHQGRARGRRAPRPRDRLRRAARGPGGRRPGGGARAPLPPRLRAGDAHRPRRLGRHRPEPRARPARPRRGRGRRGRASPAGARSSSPPTPTGSPTRPPRPACGCCRRYDPYLDQRDRDTLLPDRELRARVRRSLGNPGVVLVDGDLAGLWRPAKKGKRLVLTVEPVTAAARKRAADGSRPRPRSWRRTAAARSPRCAGRNRGQTPVRAP